MLAAKLASAVGVGRAHHRRGGVARLGRLALMGGDYPDATAAAAVRNVSTIVAGHARSKIYVFVDADNVSHRAVPAILKHAGVDSDGRSQVDACVRIFAYRDWGRGTVGDSCSGGNNNNNNNTPGRDLVRGRRDYGVDRWMSHPCVQLVDVPRWKGKKNSSDVAMAVDIVRIAFEEPDLSHAVIASNDTDFRHVMEFLRSRGVSVVLVTAAGGPPPRSPPALARWADRHAHVHIEACDQ